MKDNSLLVNRLVNKTPFLPISQIHKESFEHKQLLLMIGKMDSKSNKMIVKGLERLPTDKLKELPHLREILYKPRSRSENHDK